MDGFFLVVTDIERQVLELQAKRAGLGHGDGQETSEDERVRMGVGGHFDTDIYDHSKFTGYVTSIAPNEDQDVSHIKL